MSRSRSTLTPPLARRSTQLVIAVSVVLLFAWQATVGIRHSFRQDTATGQDAEIAPLQIDINRCESRELSLLPNLGTILAQRVISDRDSNGPFRSVDDLQRVHGIGEKTIRRISMYCIASEIAPDNSLAIGRESPSVKH